MPETLSLRETTAARLSEAAVGQGGSVLLRLIAPGWSANGRYYSESVLKQDGLKAFRAGTRSYIDHPSKSEQIDRPERSVRDLVGTLQENAYYDPSGPAGPGLYARASVRDEYRPLVDELAESIGMSIRADGTGHRGEAEGRTGMIVDTIESAESVDYVTTPAAGGKVIQLLESVQSPTRETERSDPVALQEARNAGQWLESRIHLDFTRMADMLAADGHITRDERIALSGAIGDALEAFNAAVEADAPQLYARDPFADPDAASQPAPVPTTVNESTPREDNPMPAITEAEAQKLREAESSAKAQLEEANKRAETAEAEVQRYKEHERLAEERKAIAEAVNATDIPPTYEPIAEGLRELAASRVKVSRDGDGKIVADALTEAARKAVHAEVERQAKLDEARGVGRPSGLGGNPANPTNTTTTTGTDDTLTTLDESLDGVFGKILQEA